MVTGSSIHVETLPQRVGCQPARVLGTREDACSIGGAVSEGHVAAVVHGDAAHPAVDAVGRAGCVSTLLVDCRRHTVGITDSD